MPTKEKIVLQNRHLLQIYDNENKTLHIQNTRLSQNRTMKSSDQCDFINLNEVLVPLNAFMPAVPRYHAKLSTVISAVPPKGSSLEVALNFHPSGNPSTATCRLIRGDLKVCPETTAYWRTRHQGNVK